MARKGPEFGRARVYVDGVQTAEIDLYSAVTCYQQVVFDTGVLEAGRHCIRIEWTGLKNAAATGTFIGIDAFSLTGSEAQVAMRREQEASAVAYTGTWSTWTDPALSGGSYTYANATGASVTTTVVGSGFALVARTGPEFGWARIYVDGVAEDIDLYAPSTRYQQVVVRKTLAYGAHTVKVEWTGIKNAASTGTNVNIDAIDVFTAEPGGALSFDAANRVVGFTYDSRGNVLSDGTYTYAWDAMNRLTGVKLASSGAPVASFAYDSDGMRQTATAGGVTTRFAVDAVSDEITALISATGVVVAQFIRDAAGALVAMVRSGAVVTYLTNAHGDVTALLDAAGTVVARWTYDAWGRPTEYNAAGTQVAVGTAGNPFLYAGYFFDTATGLYYLRARYYDPATGRFLSMDPEPGRMTDRLSQNPYIYCQNDPVNLADPDGRATVAGGGGGKLSAWQKVQLAALRAKRAAEAAAKQAAARKAAARKAAAAKLAAAKRAADKRAAAKSATTWKSAHSEAPTPRTVSCVPRGTSAVSTGAADGFLGGTYGSAGATCHALPTGRGQTEYQVSKEAGYMGLALATAGAAFVGWQYAAGSGAVAAAGELVTAAKWAWGIKSLAPISIWAISNSFNSAGSAVLAADAADGDSSIDDLAVAKSGAEIVQRAHQEAADKGVDYLKTYMTKGELSRYAENPTVNSRYLGTAVHRAGSESLQLQYPGRWDYSPTRPFDYIDLKTGEFWEVTTPGQVAVHVNRLDGFDCVVTYEPCW